MTDKPPAMPEHRIPDDLLYLCESEREAVRQYANAYALAALQSAQPAAAVSDAEIEEIARGKSNHIEFARAILALRPQAVPMTDRVFDLICNAIDEADTLTMEGDYMLDSDDCIAVVRVMQALLHVHHGITQRADGGEAERG